MPRDLGDVLHYFIPEAGPEARSDPGPAAEPVPPAGRPQAGRASSIVALPVEDADVLRAAFVWNLAVEAARLGDLFHQLTHEDQGPRIEDEDDEG